MSQSASNFPPSGQPLMPTDISIRALRVTFVLTILLATVLTLVPASGLSGEAPNLPITLLASVELAAIIAFAFDRWRRAAALLLVLVFAAAFLMTALEGEIAARFIFFAASALYLQGTSGKVARKEPSFA